MERGKNFLLAAAAFIIGFIIMYLLVGCAGPPAAGPDPDPGSDEHLIQIYLNTLETLQSAPPLDCPEQAARRERSIEIIQGQIVNLGGDLESIAEPGQVE